MKNLCEYCKYTTEYDGCLCGIENLDSPDGYGCNYSEEMLSLLNEYTEFKISEAYSYRSVVRAHHPDDIPCTHVHNGQ